ncbi:MAG: Leukotriene-A(4) hydrolase [Crocinitomicaceae bacterium]|jgi:aminopeptidase N|nr:Leukotriene-A(4) hydrolase [Crocinitomicaceae bacterium]
MNKLYLFFCLTLSIALSSCDSQEITENEDESKKVIISQPVRDAHSYANLDEIRTKHIHLDLEVDFTTKSIYGIARHEMVNNGTDTAIFDIKGLEINRVTIGKEGNEANADYVIGKEDPILGAPLSVKVDSNTTFINIYYKTTSESNALDWLDPILTNGKKHPYLYTQGQAILTRTWIPTQDSPSNRITYSADVKVPKELMALMSAKNPTKKNEKGEYHFEMKQPIPVYLIALAVGDLSYRKLGKNSGVYTEPSMIGKVAWEFADLQKMIGAAEELYGKYEWEQYDVIVLPYSFPFGGMENPRLTFANPTLIAGDRSLVTVIAHELAHSWSGNLVTNATWDDFWLNEGFTVYFENRIMESLYGKEVADILALIEFQELEMEIEEISNGMHPEDTYLKLALDGRDPDDGMTQIAYVKGAFFLKTLEETVGREKFDAFINKYFDTYKFKTLTTETFEKYLTENLLKPNKIKFNTKEWLYGKGMPKNCVKLVSPRFEGLQKLADDFAAGKNIFYAKRKKDVLTRDKYITQEWLAFIRKLPRDISIDKLKKLDEKLNFKNCGNAEIMTEWYVLGIQAGYTELRPNISAFLNKVGRRKFLLPIYKTLAKDAENLKFARQVYKQARPYYHSVSQKTMDDLLK